MFVNKEQLVSLWFYPIIALVGIFTILLIVLLLQKVQRWPYKKVPIMSEIEKKFYRQLKAVFPHYHILAQVQLSRVIRPPKGKNELKWLNKIWRLSLDYVILDHDLNTIAVIELDDVSHTLPHRKEADLRKDKALKAAGVYLIRIKTRHLPSNQELLSLFSQ